MDASTGRISRQRLGFGIRLLDAAGKIWTLPNTLAGLVLGLLSLVFGSRPELKHNAVVFNRFPVVKRAFTLGNVILNPAANLFGRCPTYASVAAYRKRRDPSVLEFVSLGAHEEAHTRQYQLLGPFFLPVYGVTQLMPSPTPLERAADTFAQTGTGWWPWPMGRRLSPVAD
jgi:hypothetical protein